MVIEIHKNSGFCFGVKRAVDQAEVLLEKGASLICLGDIVHNHEEVERLNKLGMHTVAHEELSNLQNHTILLRSHGEPPATYQMAKRNNNTIIDATCPVVLKLQSRVKVSFEAMQKINGQLVIYGKAGHPEVIGLLGQTNNQAIVVSTTNDLASIDFNRPVEVFSQTTMPVDTFQEIKHVLQERCIIKPIVHDTICRQVANRVPQLQEFSNQFDTIIFVSGKKSSNGKLLFEECKKNNPNSHFISNTNEIDLAWFNHTKSIGICGATSTPQWLMEDVKLFLLGILNKGEIISK